MSPAAAIRTVMVLGTVFLLTLSGCSQREELTVFAAASLTDAVTEAARLFEEQAGIPVSLSFASSSTLARQIESGADADVFLSANTYWMDHLGRQGIIEKDKRFDLLGNRLVVAVPKGSGIRLDLSPGTPVPTRLLEGRIPSGKPDRCPLASTPAGSRLPGVAGRPRAELHPL